MIASGTLTGLLAVLRGQHARKSPVLRLNLINHNVRVLRPLAEHTLQGVRDLSDYLRLLLGSNAVLGDANIDVGHGGGIVDHICFIDNCFIQSPMGTQQQNLGRLSQIHGNWPGSEADPSAVFVCPLSTAISSIPVATAFSSDQIKDIPP